MNVCLTFFYTSARKKGGTYYKSSSMIFIKEPPLIVSFVLRRTTDTNDTEFLKFSKTEGREFTKAVIPFPLVGYKINCATRLVRYLPSRIQRGLMKSLLNIILRTVEFKMAAVSLKRTAFLGCTLARFISNLVIHRATCC